MLGYVISMTRILRCLSFLSLFLPNIVQFVQVAVYNVMILMLAELAGKGIGYILILQNCANRVKINFVLIVRLLLMFVLVAFQGGNFLMIVNVGWENIVSVNSVVVFNVLRNA